MYMDNLAREYIISLFETKLMLHGDRPEAVGWSERGQRLRFKMMLDVGDFRNSRVLDFGCGKGDFYAFLCEKGIPVFYTGVDINRKLIDLAKSKYPDQDFRVFSLEDDILDEDFDYIFLCGVFNVKVEGIETVIRKTLSALWHHCRQALVFNALSSHVRHKDVALHYASPEDLLGFAKANLSQRVSLKEDTIDSDFMLFVYRD